MHLKNMIRRWRGPSRHRSRLGFENQRISLGKRNLPGDRLLGESLESREVLSAVSFAGNDCPPDLDLSAVPAQTAFIGQTYTIDLLAAGAIATDMDLSGQSTGGTLRFLLDPNTGTDTPIGASITEAGVLTWTPASSTESSYQITHTVDAEPADAAVVDKTFANLSDWL